MVLGSFIRVWWNMPESSILDLRYATDVRAPYSLTHRLLPLSNEPNTSPPKELLHAVHL
jgi:hypothetical protein